MKLHLENYRKILSGKIVLDLESRAEEKDHIKGFIKLNKDPKIENIASKNVILKECTLKLTDWVIGITIFVGDDTFIAKKSKNVIYPFSREDNYLNRVMILFIVFIIIISVVCFTFYIPIIFQNYFLYLFFQKVNF